MDIPAISKPLEFMTTIEPIPFYNSSCRGLKRLDFQAAAGVIMVVRICELLNTWKSTVVLGGIHIFGDGMHLAMFSI